MSQRQIITHAVDREESKHDQRGSRREPEDRFHARPRVDPGREQGQDYDRQQAPDPDRSAQLGH